MPLSNEDLRHRLAKQHWTAHNVRLTNEITTMSGQGYFMKMDLRLCAMSVSRAFTNQKPLDPNSNGVRA